MLTTKDIQILDKLLDKKLKPVIKKLTEITNFLDKEIVSLKNRVGRIENNLGL